MSQTICAVNNEYTNNRTLLRVTLICEGEHGLFGVPTQVWTGPDYMAIRADAAKEGWKRSGNKWLCPGCAK